MRVVTMDNESVQTRELRFARLPGPERTVVAIFKDKKGVQHAIKTSEILEIVDA